VNKTLPVPDWSSGRWPADQIITTTTTTNVNFKTTATRWGNHTLLDTVPDELLGVDWESWLMNLRQRVWLESPKRIVMAPATAREVLNFYVHGGDLLPISIDDALGVRFMNTPVTELPGLPELVAIFETED
jgi:hypothetical protein